jgi:hypothetical protein
LDGEEVVVAAADETGASVVDRRGRFAGFGLRACARTDKSVSVLSTWSLSDPTTENTHILLDKVHLDLHATPETSIEPLLDLLRVFFVLVTDKGESTLGNQLQVGLDTFREGGRGCQMRGEGWWSQGRRKVEEDQTRGRPARRIRSVWRREDLGRIAHMMNRMSA